MSRVRNTGVGGQYVLEVGVRQEKSQKYDFLPRDETPQNPGAASEIPKYKNEGKEQQKGQVVRPISNIMLTKK